MDILRISAICVITCILCLFFPSEHKEYTIYIVIASGAIILTYSLKYISPVFNVISQIASSSNVNSQQLITVIKIILTAYIAQFASDICIDAKQKNLAAKVDIAARFIILYLSLPVILTLYNYLNEVLN